MLGREGERQAFNDFLFTFRYMFEVAASESRSTLILFVIFVSVCDNYGIMGGFCHDISVHALYMHSCE